METDDFTPDLSKLEQDYQILTELRRGLDARTYLGRHRELNRDVAITVTRRGSGDRQSLSRFAGDVERLKTARHPAVIPVIEGRWLADGSFAVVRPRVRGLTLDELVSTVGAVPMERVASALRQVQSALAWARMHAIANRMADPASMIFQQGSGRVLLALEPSPTPAVHDDCDDARVLGRLGWEMLAGEPFDELSTITLAELRPDLPPEIVAQTEAFMQCTPDMMPDIGEYLAMFGDPESHDDKVVDLVPERGTRAASTPTRGETPVVASVVASVVSRTAVPAAPGKGGATASTPPALERGPLGDSGEADDAAVAPTGGWSVGARFAAGIAVVAVLALIAFFFLSRGGQTVVDRTAEGSNMLGEGVAAGDVALDTGQQDTASDRPSRLTPPSTRRHEPPTTPPPLTMPAPEDVCSSQTPDDQHACLLNAIDRQDVTLNRVYQQVIDGLRSQAGVTANDPDPESVAQLRAAEQQWVQARDSACRTAGAGPVYATERAACFAARSNERTHALRLLLGAIPDN